MTQDNTRDRELRENILRVGKVTKGIITFSQKNYAKSDGSVWGEPITIENQDIVEVGIDDLMKLINTHTKELLAEIKSQLPEMEKLSDYTLNMGCGHNPPSNTTRTNLQRRGFNDCLTQVHTLIDERMGEL